MKKLITTCVSMMTGLALFMSCQSEKADWKLVWEENFNQTDTFDPAVWSKIPRGTSIGIGICLILIPVMPCVMGN